MLGTGHDQISQVYQGLEPAFVFPLFLQYESVQLKASPMAL